MIVLSIEMCFRYSCSFHFVLTTNSILLNLVILLLKWGLLFQGEPGAGKEYIYFNILRSQKTAGLLF